jgi:glycosyltransferase involved in cell wall biosynthesis
MVGSLTSTQPEEQLTPRVSVVIAVFNGGLDLEKCLAAIRESSYPVHECILVDDASTDGMVKPAAERHQARVIKLDRQSGPAAARNHGVAEAQGDIIFFTDADVLLHPDAIARAVDALQSDAEVAAVFGSYDDKPGHTAFLSQYRNLLHHWVHQTGSEEASTFWTGCGAIRRSVFLKLDGFSLNFQRPSIEDIELGARLRKNGYKIRLLKNMNGKHTKRWAFWNMVKTDLFHRAIPWMLLLLRDKNLTNDLNLNYKSRIATVLAGLLGLVLFILVLSGHSTAILPVALFLVSSLIGTLPPVTGNDRSIKNLLAPVLAILIPLAGFWLAPDPLAAIPLTLVLAIALTHLPFYQYVTSKRGYAFAIAMVPLQVVFFVSCALSIPVALILFYLGNRSAKTSTTEEPH